MLLESLYKPHFMDLHIHHSNLNLLHLFFKQASMAATVDHKTLDMEPPTNGNFLAQRCNSFRSPSFKIKRHPEITLTINDDDDDDDSSFDRHDDNNDYFRDLIRKGKEEIEPSVLDPRDEGTADNGIIRNPSMIRLTGKHPFNSEPPLDRLMRHGFITPAPLHYVRNHGPVPKADSSNWTIEIIGLLENPTTFTLQQLVNDFRWLNVYSTQNLLTWL